MIGAFDFLQEAKSLVRSYAKLSALFCGLGAMV